MAEKKEKMTEGDLFSQAAKATDSFPALSPGQVKPEMPNELVAMSLETKNEEGEYGIQKKTPQATSGSLALEQLKREDAVCLFRLRGFLRAYNRSAWLISVLYRPSYKIMRDKLRTGETYVYLGFPYKYLGEVFPDTCRIVESGNQIEVTLPEESLKGLPPYETWLKEAKITDKKEVDLPSETNMPLSSVMHVANAQEIALRLATYHIERHTILENVQFLSELIAGIEYKD